MFHKQYLERDVDYYRTSFWLVPLLFISELFKKSNIAVAVVYLKIPDDFKSET